MAEVGEQEALVVQGSVTVGDMDVGGGYGKIYNKGKKMTSVASINTLDPSIYKGSTKMWVKGEACHIFFGDIKRQWQAGGLILQGSVNIGDMDSTVNYGDINRNWTSGGATLQGSITVDDMDNTVNYGDIKREWSITNGITFTENYKLDSDGNEVAESGTLLSSYIPISNSTSVTYYGMTAFLAEYNADKVWLDYWNAKKDSSGNMITGARKVNLTGGTSTAYMRFCVLATNKDNCYLYDETNKIYLFKGRNVA